MNRQSVMLVALVLGGFVSQLPVVGEFFIYDRSAIQDGELWRLFTCHLVHHSVSHLLGNIAVVGISGAMLLRAGHHALIVVGVAATILVTGPLLFASEPLMKRFCGLSGLGTLLLSQLIVTRLRVDRGGRTYWSILGVLMLAKFGLELNLAEPLLSGADQFVPVPLAHLIGLVIGVGIGVVAPRAVSGTERATLGLLEFGHRDSRRRADV
jgi:rhomboid family GlyGly-CTERM serine protease